MKELSTEEKAQAYDEALERAKEQLDGAKVFDYMEGQIAHDIRTTTYAIFPELKESEDEKIKNRLIKLIKMSSEVGGFALHKWEADEMLTWLEKQGQVKESEISQHENKTCKENDNSLTCDGFDAELNALLKKYEHLPKEEVAECLSFYLGVVQGEQKPKWSEEDERGSDETLELLEYCINYTPEFRRPAIRRSIDWIKSLKERMEK